MQLRLRPTRTPTVPGRSFGVYFGPRAQDGATICANSTFLLLSHERCATYHLRSESLKSAQARSIVSPSARCRLFSISMLVEWLPAQHPARRRGCRTQMRAQPSPVATPRAFVAIRGEDKARPRIERHEVEPQGQRERVDHLYAKTQTVGRKSRLEPANALATACFLTSRMDKAGLKSAAGAFCISTYSGRPSEGVGVPCHRRRSLPSH